jgi:hypothetical protein
MILLNFAHPLTDEQLLQVATLVGEQPMVRSIPTNMERSRPLAEVALEIVDAAGLSSTEWQTLPLLINPPGLAPLGLALIAEIHGRCGYFSPILNIRPVPDAMPPRFDVAEIVNLQALRDAARARRG